MSDWAVLLPKWSPLGAIILAKCQAGHCYTFWTMTFSILTPVANFMDHPLVKTYLKLTKISLIGRAPATFWSVDQLSTSTTTHSTKKLGVVAYENLFWWVLLHMTESVKSRKNGMLNKIGFLIKPRRFFGFKTLFEIPASGWRQKKLIFFGLSHLDLALK